TEVFDWALDDAEITIVAKSPSDDPDCQTETETAEPPVPAVQAPGAAATSANPGQNPTQPVDSGNNEATARKANANGASIRVSIDKIDELINQVGELVITQSMLSRFGDDLEHPRMEALREGLDQLRRNTRELQESAMRIRMLPIGNSFGRFPRLVRDLSQKLGKKVQLQINGESTEVDKTVMERIADPLVHLVRNALDHGLETTEKRLSAGKEETGTLSLNAYHQGGNIFIEVSDDGAGLNHARILEKARAKGLVSPGQELSDDEINMLIFKPGFSTAQTVSDVSGRGVGMDVVLRNIEELSGQVTVDSTPGEGSTFRIRLPLTLAILDGQLTRVGEQTFVLPLLSIVESLQIKQAELHKLSGETELFRLRNEYIPVVRLHELFGVPRDGSACAPDLLVVVESDTARIGLLVDELLGQQQVVIKSLEANYKQVAGLQGATILGDGTVALIADTTALVELNSQPREPLRAA
ncbi:MAG: chemotaxis protein CheA, partial [Gammaproteobacteria bacterium]